MKPLRVLLVEDNEDDALLVLRELRRNHYDVVFEHVETAEAMGAALDNHSWDIIISDFSMPSFSAPAALQVVQQRGIDLPFIIVSGTVGEEAAVAAMKAGAHDFFPKHNLTRLVQAIEREIREAQERQKRRQAEQALQKNVKELSSLYNATSYLFNADNVRNLALQIVQGVVQEFDQVDCGLFLVDKEHQELMRVARTGKYNIKINAPIKIEGRGLVPKAAREGNMIYAPNVLQVDDYEPNVPITRSEIVVPLKTHNGIIGVLDLQSAEYDDFSENAQRVLSAFAERAAAAIEIMQLYEEVNRYATELELRVAERTKELQTAKERVEAILNNSSDAIILMLADGTIQQTNPSFNLLFDYETDVLFGRNITYIVSSEKTNDLMQVFQEVAANRAYRRLEVVAHRKDGTTFPADAALSTFADNEELGIVCSLRDISSQKELETELRQALEHEKELMNLKTQFISMVSHEYRTPLTTILTSSSLLQDYSHRLSEEKKQQHFEKIRSEVKRLTALVDDVIKVNKGEIVGQDFIPEIVDLAELCQEIVEDIRQNNSTHDIVFKIVGSVVPIIGNNKLLRQIISNLLSNAVKYSPQQPSVVFNVTFSNTQVIMEFQDRGIGIPEEDIAHLFTIYHRSTNVGNIHGTGLGLVIVQQAVAAHSGTVSVTSKVGQGSTFTVILPILERIDD